MSLKAFHIFFVTSATMLAVGFGVWSLRNGLATDGSKMDFVYGIGSLIAAVALVIYGRYFLKKLKHVSYL